MTLASTPSPPQQRELTVTYRLGDKIFRGIVTAGALTSLVILGLIGIFLFVRGGEIFKDFGLKFITGSEWTAGNGDGTGRVFFSIGPMLFGTILTSLIALIIAVPLAIGGALFIEFYTNQRIKRVLVTLLDLASAIPSLVFGLWGIIVFMQYGERWARLLHHYLGWIPLFKVEIDIFTRSPFIAGSVLAAMIVPIITSVAREVYSRVPRELIDSCYSLGSTKWGAMRTVVLPFGRSGVVGGAMLGLGRALGETVAVYLLLNLVFKINFNILESEGGSIASLIATKFGEATEYEIKGLMAAGLVLFLLTMSVNMGATYIVQRGSKVS